MNSIFELFQYQFFTNAVFAAIMASITCGIIGSYIVSRRIVFISGGITHASFGGIGIAWYMGLNQYWELPCLVFYQLLGLNGCRKKLM